MFLRMFTHKNWRIIFGQFAQAYYFLSAERVMNQFKYLQIFNILFLATFSASKFSFSLKSFKTKFDKSYGTFTIIQKTSFKTPGIYKIEIYQDLLNLSVRLIADLPSSNANILDNTVNICSILSARSNIFVRLFVDSYFGKNKTFACPIKKGVTILTGASIKDFQEKIEQE